MHHHNNSANLTEGLTLYIFISQGKTNFFEKRVGEYAKAGLMAETKEENMFSLDADF